MRRCVRLEDVGGSVGEDEPVDVGFERWFKALDSFDVAVPVLVENTAGSGNTVMQNLDNYGPLWAAIGDLKDASKIMSNEEGTMVRMKIEGGDEGGVIWREHPELEEEAATSPPKLTQDPPKYG